MIKPRYRRVVAVFVAASVTASLGFLESSSGARARYRRSNTRVARGVVLSRILDRRGPNRIRVLSIEPTSPVVLDTVLSNEELPGRETTSSMARRRGAVAAINGTFGLPWGRPVGIFAEDGDLKASPLVWGRAFAISRDERDRYIGHPQLEMTASEPGVKPHEVVSWNEGRPGKHGIAAFSPAGGEIVKPPRRACSVRLYPTGPLLWLPSRNGVARDYVVDLNRCAYSRTKRRRGVVLSARRRGSKADEIKGMLEGEPVRLSWAIGWTGVLDVIAGNPTLLEGGRTTAYDCPDFFCQRHPRTGIGWTKTGKILLVTVDGRQKRWSRGMTLVQFARLFRYLGATWALNLDGGGSTTMVVRGDVVNRPSDSTGQRAVSSAIVVLPRADKGETEPAPFTPQPSPSPSVTPTPSPSLPTPGIPEVSLEREVEVPGPARDVDPSLMDPASTGGYLEALSSGALGRDVGLPPVLRRFVRRFVRMRSP